MFFAALLFISTTIAASPWTAWQAPKTCDRDLRSVPAQMTHLRFSPIERQISAGLEELFTAKPMARSKLMSAFYESRLREPNPLFENAFRLIPSAQRVEFAKTALEKDVNLFEIVLAEASTHPGFDGLFEGNEFEKDYFYSLSQAAKTAGYAVESFTDGIGNFEIIVNSRTGKKRFYGAGTGGNYAALNEKKFTAAIPWLNREKSILSRINIWSGTDQLQTQVDQLPFPANFYWRYAINNLSDETYATALKILKLGYKFDLKRVQGSPEGYLARQVWDTARRLDIPLMFSGPEYESTELSAIGYAYQLSGHTSEGHESGERYFYVADQTVYFVKERNVRGQIIFRRAEQPSPENFSHQNPLFQERCRAS